MILFLEDENDIQIDISLTDKDLDIVLDLFPDNGLHYLKSKSLSKYLTLAKKKYDVDI